MNWVMRDLLELAMLIALGGAIVTAWKAWRRGQIAPQLCEACGLPASRAYMRCRHCGALQADSQADTQAP